MAHKLRATLEPTVVREVEDAELVDLARQGLIHSYERTDAAKAVLDAFDLKPETRAPWKAPKKGEEIVTPPEPAGASAPVTDDTKGA